MAPRRAAAVEIEPPVPTAPSVPGRRERRVAETRGAILAAARQLFDQHGYAETTVDQIAGKADVAPRTFFRYFPNKEALLFAGLEDVRQSLFAALEARPRTEHPLRSVVIAFTESAEMVATRHDDIEWGFRTSEENQGGAVYDRTMLKSQSADDLAGFIAERLDVDIDDDPRPRAWAIMMLSLFGAAIRTALGSRGEGRIAEVFAELVADTLAGLRLASRSH